eukprot:GILJ01005106.1.p1 GENE.GILJ01005106.1~~GILJ01005106.1.p1  ORF type:complete len:859 (-),score=93.67 GILJ01005106.1:299-2875(-)
MKVIGSQFSYYATHPSPAKSHADKCGYLHKKGDVVKSWKRRWFLLKANCFYYFHNDDDAEPIGVIFLENFNVLPISEEQAGRPYAFKIEHEGAREFSIREFILSADSEEDRQEWVDVIQRHKFSVLTATLRKTTYDKLLLKKEFNKASVRIEALEQDKQRLADEIADLQRALEEVHSRRLTRKDQSTNTGTDDLDTSEHPEQPTESTVDADSFVESVSEPVIREPIETLTSVMETRGVLSDFAPLKIWVGTWNMGVKDPFDNTTAEEAVSLLDEFIKPGYDLYVLGVQECVGDKVFQAVQCVFEKRRDPIDRIMLGEGSRVAGRGDGSFIGQKYTGLGLFLNRSLRQGGFVRLLKNAAVSLGLSEGSKGGVGAVLWVMGSTIAFINCHLSANSVQERRHGYQYLVDHLGNELGNRFFQLNEQFHHIVWMGDLNYRCFGISVNDTLSKIAKGELTELREHYDEMTCEIKNGNVFHRFKEPRMAPDFYPTYKKYENRPKSDYSDPKWVVQCYRTSYKEPWYKSGRTKARIPGWCDRIIYRSSTDLEGYLTPEPAVSTVNGAVNGDSSTEHDVYSSINDGLVCSDHSPVYGAFVLKVPGAGPPPRLLVSLQAAEPDASIPQDVALLPRIKLCDIRLVVNGVKETPRNIRVLLPAPFEDATIVCEKITSKGTSREAAFSYWDCVYTGTQPLESLHGLIKVRRNDSRISCGQCLFALSVPGLFSAEGVEFLLPLTRNGTPMKDGDTPVLLNFTVSVEWCLPGSASGHFSQRHHLRKNQSKTSSWDPTLASFDRLLLSGSLTVPSTGPQFLQYEEVEGENDKDSDNEDGGVHKDGGTSRSVPVPYTATKKSLLIASEQATPSSF